MSRSLPLAVLVCHSSTSTPSPRRVEDRLEGFRQARRQQGLLGRDEERAELGSQAARSG